MGTPRDKARIFANTQELLAMAVAGLRDAIGPDPARRRAGLMNLFTYGRSVTMAIQTMKYADKDFEAWWKPYQELMQRDPLMRYFNKTRTDILHEGELATASYTIVGVQGPIDLGAVMQELGKHAPPNTIATFFGDQLGGNGWEVRMPDGSTEKVYFQLPADIGIESGLQLDNPPQEHKGEPITDTSIPNLGGLYVAMLTDIVNEFIARFQD